MTPPSVALLGDQTSFEAPGDAVGALASREHAAPVNRECEQRLMRDHRLLQPTRTEGRRRRPGFFQVTRPDELRHLARLRSGSSSTAWCYLSAAIDCWTREITG